MDLTQEAIIALLIEEGGKLKNSELLIKFKDSLNCTDPAEKKQNRDLFKRFVNTVAVVKEIEDVRYIVLKKTYQHLLQETEDVQKSESEDVPEPGEPSPAWNSESNAHSQNGGSETSSENVQEPVITSVGECVSNDSDMHSFIELALKEKVDFKPKRSLNFNIDHTSVAQREYISSGGAVYPGKTKNPSVQNTFGLPLRMPPNLTRIEIHKLKSEEDDGPPRRAGSTDQDAHCSSRTKRRPSTRSVGLSSPLPRRAVKITKPSEEPKYTSTVPLEEAEHEWLVRSAAGHWRRVYGLLLRDTQLAEKKDFMSGFTALHWAAKCGNSEMVGSIINISRQGGMDLDVNARTYGGYTPLHIAALHDQEFVLAMLVHEYGADVNAGVFSNGSRVEVEADIHCLRVEASLSSSGRERLLAPPPPPPCTPEPLEEGVELTLGEATGWTDLADMREDREEGWSVGCGRPGDDGKAMGKRRGNGSVAPQEKSHNLIEVAADAPSKKGGGYFTAPAQPDPDDQFIIPPELVEEVKEIMKQHQQKQLKAPSPDQPADY